MIDFPLIPANAVSIAGRKKVCGVGINDADYLVQPTVNGKKIKCTIYTMWSSMILRCYDPKYSERFITYKNCSVDPIWHSFMNFRQWVLSQPSYIGLDLDKDLLYTDNKIYSPLFKKNERMDVYLNKSFENAIYDDNKMLKDNRVTDYFIPIFENFMKNSFLKLLNQNEKEVYIFKK